MKSVVATILLRYRLSLVSGHCVEQKMSLTLFMKNRLRVNLHPRVNEAEGVTSCTAVKGSPTSVSTHFLNTLGDLAFSSLISFTTSASTEVVLGSSRLHKSSRRSSNRSGSEATAAQEEVMETEEDQRFEFRAPSWITFLSMTSSQRHKSSVSEDVDVDGKNSETTRTVVGSGGGVGDALMCLEEEIKHASPRQSLFLQHNF